MSRLAIIAAILSLALLPVLATAGDKSDKSTILTGCLGGRNPDGAYTLKTSAKDVQVNGASDLESLVGHEVKLTGTWTKAASDIGTMSETAATGEKKHTHDELKVKSIEHVADTCTTESKADKKSGD